MTTALRPRRPRTAEAVPVTSEILDQPPPQDTDAEVALLGSIMLSAEAFDEVAGIVRTEDFYDESHAAVWKTLARMHDSRIRVDAVTLVRHLKQDGAFDAAGGAAGIAKMFQAVPNAYHAAWYAQQVRDAAIRRDLMMAAMDTIRDCHDEHLDGKTCLDQHDSRVTKLADRELVAKPLSGNDLAQKALELLERRMNPECGDAVVPTGFSGLDGMLGGFREGDLIILAARPSMGKSALAMNIAQHSIQNHEAPVLYFSLEMSSEQLADRLLSGMSGVSGVRMRGGTVNQEERGRICEAAARLSRLPLHVVDLADLTVRTLAAQARRLKRKHHALRLIVVDYLQLMTPLDARMPREQQVATMARGLKLLARELAVPVLCLSQLNRQAEQSSDHRPKLSHLRESGAIEQDADVVIFVHREEVFQPKNEDLKGQAELIVAKQRNGPTGTDESVVWMRETMQFKPKAPERISDFDAFNAQPHEPW